jgi:hypothetical protein
LERPAKKYPRFARRFIVELEDEASEPEVGCIDWVVLVEFIIGKGALLELDMVDLVVGSSVEVVLLLIADVILLEELEEVIELEDPVPVGPAVVVELPMVKGVLLDELEVTTELEAPVPVGPAVAVELPIVKCALLELMLELELVTGAEVMEALDAVGPVEAVLLFPMVKRAELEELRREEVVMPPVDIAADDVSFPLGNGALLLEDITLEDEVVLWVTEVVAGSWEEVEDPVPVGSAEDTVLLPILNRTELEELALEDATLLSEVVVDEISIALEDLVPVGPADSVVLLPMAKTAELEELGLQDWVLLLEAIDPVKVLFVTPTDTELEEVIVGEVNMFPDPVGPVEVVELPMGKGILLLVPTAPEVEDTLTLDTEVVVPLLVGSMIEVLDITLDEDVARSLLVVLSTGTDVIELEALMLRAVGEETAMEESVVAGRTELDDRTALDANVDALSDIDPMLEEEPIAFDEENGTLVVDIIKLEETDASDVNVEVLDVVKPALEEETIVLGLELDITIPVELSVEDIEPVPEIVDRGTEEPDTTWVEEPSNDWVEEINVDAFVRLAELDKEVVGVNPADPDATLDEPETSPLLEAVDWTEDDWTTRREVAMANKMSLSACRLLWSIPLKYKQEDVSVLNEVATQRENPAQVSRQVESVGAACLLAATFKGVPL